MAAPLALVSQGNQCPRCSAELPPHAKTCPSCLHDIDGDKDVYEIAADADLETATWLGGGAVYSTTVVRRKPDQGGDYNVAVIELVEGPRLMSRVVDIAPMDVSIGMRVRAAIDQTANGPLLVFRRDA